MPPAKSLLPHAERWEFLYLQVDWRKTGKEAEVVSSSIGSA
jgi:hypothetical protein